MSNNIHIVLLLIFLVAAMSGCKKTCGESGAEPCPCPACPTITALIPDHASGGDTLRVIGTNFGTFAEGVDKITINGQEASLAGPALDTELLAIVPEQAGDGPVIITIGSLRSDEVGESPHFTYDYVVLNEIAPTSGTPGDVIFLYGNYFSPIIAENLVSFSGGDPFNAIVAEVVAASDSVLQVVVPEGGESGEVKVEVGGHEAGGPVFTYLTKLELGSISPDYGRMGDVITITGDNLDPDPGQYTVTFASGATGMVTQAASDQISVEVPSQAGSGPIAITMASLSGETAPFFYEYTATVSTIAGVPGAPGSTEGVGGKLYFPTGLAVDGNTSLFVADSKNHKIRTIELSSGEMATYAGEGPGGFQDGAGHIANFHYPLDVTLDVDGNLYVADYFNRRIRKISPAKMVSTLAGNGTQGYKDGTGGKAQFDSPYGVRVDGKGNVFVADRTDHRIRKVTAAGSTSTLAGSGVEGNQNGKGILAQFRYPVALALGQRGNLLISDLGNHQIRQVSGEGSVSTLAGTGASGYSNGNGVAVDAQFKSPYGIAMDSYGNIFIADENHRIRMISPQGRIALIAGNGQPGHQDGEGLLAQFNSPRGMCFDADGNLYVADSDNHVIRKVLLE